MKCGIGGQKIKSEISVINIESNYSKLHFIQGV